LRVAESASVFRRVADTLEQSAALADAYAERYEQAKRSDDAVQERRVARRTREAARMARSHAEEWLELAASRRPLPQGRCVSRAAPSHLASARASDGESAGKAAASPSLVCRRGRGSARWVWSSVVASCLGAREVCSGSRRRSLELFASLSGCSIFDLVGRVVVSELALRLVRQQSEKADVGVGHGRVEGSGAGIERAAAWGSSMGGSSGPRRRKPKALWRVI
jgi:hypothetical protein